MNSKILTINMTEKEVLWSEVPEEYIFKGGRSLTSSIVSDEVDPLCHPLGKNNMLVIAPGLISGSYLSSSNRLSVGTKSPLTGGIKESNSGGVVCLKLARLGIKALKITGSSIYKAFPSLGIIIDSKGVRIENFDFLKGLGTYKSAELLLRKFGKKIGFLVIGPAGELMLNSACININDTEGEPCRNLGRGGLGAVMGSKGIKVIIVDDSEAGPLYKENTVIKQRIRTFSDQLRKHPVTGEMFAMYGTVMTLLNLNNLGGLATRNFSQGKYEHAEKIGAETIRQNMLDRGGLPSHSCMPGCVIRCSNKYVDKEGQPIVGSMEFETVALLGSNIDNPDPDEIAKMNYICNDIGVDTMEMGCALGVLCDAGFVSYGDTKRFKELLHEVGKGTLIGRMLGAGAAVCGKIFSVNRVPAVKGQGMAAYDPRSIKGMGVTYAKTPMGADHTAANAITLDADHLDPSAQITPIKDLMIKTMILDSFGLCIFTGRVSLGNPSILEELVKDYTGKEFSFKELSEEAWKDILKEKDFNQRAGISDIADDVPEFMRNEPLFPLKTVFDIPKKDLDNFFNQ